jgi:hypothetical protein
MSVSICTTKKTANSAGFCRRIDRTPHFPDEAFDFQRAN